jgi:hypothetical protein
MKLTIVGDINIGMWMKIKLKELSEASIGFYDYKNLLVQNTPANFKIIKTNGRY